LRIGIDLGGTKIAGIALDGDAELVRRRIQTPRGDYAATIEAVAALVSDIERTTRRQGTVGIGIPGTISPATGLVRNANSVWLNGRPLGADLEARLGRPVKVANDANCFIVSEAADGAAAEAQVAFGVIVGTGTGGGVVVRGGLLAGLHGIAGEWGHNPLPWPAEDEWPGPPCYCGKSGCIETFLSGPAVAREYLERTGQALTAEQIAVSSEAAAVEALARYESRMARALASVINLLDPDVIVLGGGLSKIGRLYENVPRLWSRHVFSAGAAEPVRARLVAARHGDASGVRGAAWLWRDGAGA
jgi:fructokinase